MRFDEEQGNDRDIIELHENEYYEENPDKDNRVELAAEQLVKYVCCVCGGENSEYIKRNRKRNIIEILGDFF